MPKTNGPGLNAAPGFTHAPAHRTHQLHLLVTEAEYDALRQAWKQTVGDHEMAFSAWLATRLVEISYHYTIGELPIGN